MNRVINAAIAVAALCATVPAAAQSVQARQFGARETVREVSISPDGARMALLVASGPRGTGLMILGTDGQLKQILNFPGTDSVRLASCAWSTSQRLICTLFGIVDGKTLSGMSRMIALDADGSNVKQLSAPQRVGQLYERYYGGGVLDWLPDDKSSAVLMLRHFVPEQTVGTLLAQQREGIGVERVDTVTLKRTVVEPARGNSEFITDGHGTVRIVGTRSALSSGYAGNEVVYKYRRPGSSAWEPLSTVVYSGYTSRGFAPYAVDRDLNVVYGYDAANGRQALFKIALDGSMRRELVLANDRVDVDGLVRIGRQQRVIGVSWATDERQVAYFDPAIKALAASIAKAVPGLPIVGFGDASADEKKLVVFAGSDVDPGRYYLLDRATKKMAEISPARPELANVQLASVKAITYKAADGTAIPAYLTLPVGSTGKGLPAIVMPHGGPTARDEWGFDWLAQFFASRGYAVIQPNYRGSAGYGAAWLRQNGFRAWRTSIGDVNDAGRWLVSQGIAAPDKLAIVGWSYGGYAALQSGVLDPALFEAVAAIAPVTDLATLRDEMKNDGSSDQDVQAILGEAGLWGEASPAQNAARIKAPVLLFHGTQDMNVNVSQSRVMAARLRAAGGRVDYAEYPGLDHQLDDSAVRTQMLDRIDQFLRVTMKLPAMP